MKSLREAEQRLAMAVIQQAVRDASGFRPVGVHNERAFSGEGYAAMGSADNWLRETSDQQEPGCFGFWLQFFPELDASVFIERLRSDKVNAKRPRMAHRA